MYCKQHHITILSLDRLLCKKYSVADCFVSRMDMMKVRDDSTDICSDIYSLILQI